MSWEKVALGDICSFQGGGTPKKIEPDYWVPEVPWASVKDFKSTSLEETQDSISWLGLKNSASNLIKAGTVIVPTRMALGKAAINTIDVAINQDLRALILRDNIDERFIMHAYTFLGSEIERHGSGATVKGITQDKLKQIKIPLPMKNGKPDLLEQQRIAGILDQADAIRRKRQQALQLTDDFLRATFLDLFGDPVTNPKGWEVKPLVDEAEVITGYAFPSSEYIEAGEGIPLCRGINVGVGKFNWKDRSDWELPLDPSLTKFQLKTDDIILAMDRPWIKEGLKITKVCKHQEKSLLVQRVARIRATSPARQNLIYFLLNHPVFERHCKPTETTIPHISPVELKEFPVIHPPKELVEQFQKLVQAVDQKVIKLQTGKENDLFASLQQRAFKGEL